MNLPCGREQICSPCREVRPADYIDLVCTAVSSTIEIALDETSGEADSRNSLISELGAHRSDGYVPEKIFNSATTALNEAVGT